MPKEQESRPVKFRRLYAKHYAEVWKQFFLIGPRAEHGCWPVSGGRKRVRALARLMARNDARQAA